MLFEITDGTVSAGGRQILSHIDFGIRGTEHIGVVGRNGAGKTTLLRLLAGELSLDRDDKRQGPGIRTARKLTVRMLSQTPEKDLDKTVEEMLLEECAETEPASRERFAFMQAYDRLLTGLGFCKEDKGRRLSDFSGGEQTKLELIRLLLSVPDILLLDEPTNHLDLEACEWLEGHLKEYQGAVVIVSHDRFFLDRVVTVVYELQDSRLVRYSGNYTAYRRQKLKALASARRAYESQQQEIARLNDLIEKFRHKPRKAAFARSRRSILERMEKLPKPAEDEAHLFTGEIQPLVRPPKWIAEAKELQVGYDRTLLQLSLRVRSGQKIGIIGANGAGKTTLLKTIAQELPPRKGECRLGERVTMGYFDQQSANLVSEKTVAEHFHALFPGMPEKDVRQRLGAWLFAGREAQKKVSSLSGGEKARLLLAEMLESRPNLLLLDEPTNHMDIPAKETLESAFQAYTGTILFVSHDRYFIRQVADAILVLEDGRAMYYPFGYEHYLERKGRGDGEALSALIRAEDQALVEGLRAVPEKERHRLREYSTEAQYRDWVLRLAGEQMEQAAREYLLAEAAWMDAMLREEEAEAAAAVVSRAEAAWTEACIAWAEAYFDSDITGNTGREGG